MAEQGDAEAVKWYRKAAEQGNRGGQLNLGASYANAKGVPLDYVRAYAWCSLAAAQGVRPAMQCTRDLRGTMTPAQIAEAEELSVSLPKRIYQQP